MNKYGNNILMVVSEPPALLGGTQIAFRHAGYRLTMALSLQDAVARLHEAFFDLIITDISTLWQEGLDRVAEIQRLRPGTMIMILTGKDKHDLGRCADGTIPDYFLVEPGPTDKPLLFPCWEENPAGVN